MFNLHLGPPGKVPSEAAFRAAAEWIPHILWTATPDGKVDFANRIYTAYTGVSLDVEQRSWIDALHPDDVNRCLHVWSECVELGIPYSIDFRLIHKATGVYRWMAVRANPVMNETDEIVKWYGICTDIHELRLANETIAHLAGRLNRTLESMTDGFLMLDKASRVIYANESFTKLFQPAKPLVGELFWEKYPSLIGGKGYQECIQAISEDLPHIAEYFSSHLGRWIEMRCYPNDDGVSIYLRDITRRKESEARIEHLAFFDQLTGLANRQLLHDRLCHAVVMSARSGLYGAALYLDLDDFKHVNDGYGHDSGDSLLQHLAHRLKDVARESDTVARLGGDEFVLILEELGDSPDVAARAVERFVRRLLEVMQAPYPLQGREHVVSASVGIALFRENTSPEEVLKRSDMAMYQAKISGRNSFRFFDPKIQSLVDRRIEVEAGIREGLKEKDFLLNYQLQYDNKRQVVGAEALLRWGGPESPYKFPAIFIPVAEETGLIHELGELALQQACQQLVAWKSDKKTATLPISVNVSAHQFRRNDFVTHTLQVIERTSAPADRLKFELTESVFLSDLRDAIKKINKLKEFGIGFSLDDFGTGYSSLSYLRDLPFDQLKIDRSFVERISSSSKDVSILKTVIALGKALGIVVVAEGVETEDQFRVLGELGCDAYQGFLFSRPSPSNELF